MIRTNKEIHSIPVYEFDFDTDSLEQGASIMSLVNHPASETVFLALSAEETQNIKLSVNDEKRIVTGVALRANYPILRNQAILGVPQRFYFEIPKEKVELMMQKFMKENRTHFVDVDHKTPIEGVYLIESFLLSEAHNLSYPEFKDIELGSWMVSYKVDNDVIWSAIKNGDINGFSPDIKGTLKGIEDTNLSLTSNKNNFTNNLLTILAYEISNKTKN